MTEDDDALFGKLRGAVAELVKTDGLSMINKWNRHGINPMVSCLALIRLAYTLAPVSNILTSEGPESFSHLCKLVAEKEGIIEEYFSLNDNDPN